MRLLFFLHSLATGGAERVTATLANHWAGKGWPVTIVTLEGIEADAQAIDASIERISLDLATPSHSPLATIGRNIERIRALRRVLTERGPNVAIAMMDKANVVLAGAALGLSQTATIGSERIHPPGHATGRALNWTRALAYGRLGAVVAQTSTTQAWLTAHTYAKRVVVIPNAVAWPLEESAPILNPAALVPASGRMLLAAGRLDHQKGFDRLIEVFSRLSPVYPEWTLTILGDGPQRKPLTKMRDALGLGDRVTLPGRAGNMTAWYDTADLFVLSSRFEGFPNVLLEAMAHGLAAVSVDCDTGPRDIIQHEVDGMLVPQDDADALEGALADLMADQALRARLAARAIAVRERFALTTIASQWEHLFDELAAT